MVVYVCHKKQRQLLLYCMCVLHFPPSTLQQKKYLTRPPVTGSNRQFFTISIMWIRISCFKVHSSWQNKVLEILLKRSFFKWIIHLFSSNYWKTFRLMWSALLPCLEQIKKSIMTGETLPSIFGLLCDGLNWQVWTLTLNGLIRHAFHILLKGSMYRKLCKNNTKMSIKLNIGFKNLATLCID